jgi:hypothetical protein
VSDQPTLPPGSLLASGFRALEQAMAEVPDEKRGAMVFGATTDGVLSVGMATRAGDDWRIEGQLAVDVSGGRVKNIVGSIRAGVTWD